MKKIVSAVGLVIALCSVSVCFAQDIEENIIKTTGYAASVVIGNDNQANQNSMTGEPGANIKHNSIIVDGSTGVVVKGNGNTANQNSITAK